MASQRRSKKGNSAPSQDEKQGRIKVAKKNDGLKHKYATAEAMEDLEKKVTKLPELEECKKLSATELNECVVEVMRYLLAHNQSKPMVPVSNTAISKVLKELNTNAQGQNKHVIPRARVGFMGLGWDLVEMGNSYMLRSFVPFEFRLNYLLKKHDTSMHAVRLMVAMFLHTNGYKVSSDALRKFLDRFGLQVSLKKEHKVDDKALASNKNQFGTENPVALLVEQKFLKKTSEETLDQTKEDFYSMGEAQTGGAVECTEEDMQGHLKDFMSV